ncbi:MAG TPA: phage holin family protein [Pseudonocardiaceae bacterium]|nr:phage holin family protein [Pseudonocardiaceae bacterium]
MTDGTNPLPGERSVAQLVEDATTQLRTLVHDEIQLVGIELSRKGKRLGVGAGAFGGAGLIAAYAGLALMAGVILLLATVWAVWVAALVVGGAGLLVAGGLALAGRSQVKRAVPPIPTEAMAGVQEDIKVVKEGVHR